ncbi:MAG: response regulator transcription factor [Sphingobium sp.]|nr:response regulator transcription factor [Sphingobium sp.]
MLDDSTIADDSVSYTAEASHRAEPAAALPQLTPTQRKVLEGVHLGLLNKQIAFNLGIAEATVKAHMTALMRKLNVRNRTQVAIMAQTMADHTAFEPVAH